VSVIESLIKRRQFLLGAVGSTCALTCKKLAAFAVADGANASKSPVHAAVAAQKASAAAVMAAGNNCPHLLSPLRIRNVVLKNRIMHTVSPAYFMQGPENFPAEMYRNHYSNMAKNAAIVSMNTHYGKYPKTYAKGQIGPSANFCDTSWEDIPPVENYVQRLMEDIHCEGALILSAGNTGALGAFQASSGAPSGPTAGAPGSPGSANGPSFVAPSGGQVNVEELVARVKEAEAKGYDVFRLDTHNTEALRALRNATDLILLADIVGTIGARSGKNSFGVTNNNQPSASEIEKGVEAARKLEGLVDIVTIRTGGLNAWTEDQGKPFSLPLAEAIKKAGIKVITCPCGGFHNPIQNEEFIATGKTDMVGMTRPFFADPELARKLRAGMADDVIPCIGCQNCHGVSLTAPGPWYATCTVNPKWGLPPYKLTSITAPRKTRKVAVIGGGPAGMKAAIVAAERGHKVTLYEKSDALGGLQKVSDYSQWRWTFKDLKDYYIYQVNKAGIDVQLKTAATPQMIKSKGYDTVLVATGAEPVISKLEGADPNKVFDIVSAYTNKKALGENVVIIGAGKLGTEAGLGLAKDGHTVTVLASSEDLVEPENCGPENVRDQFMIIKYHPKFKYLLGVTIKGVTGGMVTYTNSDGKDESVQADSIVVWSGLKPRMDEAEKFFGSADEVLLLGDCTGKNGSLQKSIRSAFFVASQV
jgi:2,4-dienoyl-CoA reductase-like NADH-dependent reductase (Old Yellow Enzyme family)/thioredoxin reductase